MSNDDRVELEGVVVLRRELLAEGLTDSDIRAQLRAGVIHRVRHGSYVDAALWNGLSELDRHRVRVRAVLKRAKPGTVASHVSAAVEHGAPVWGIPLDQVHVTSPDGTPARKEAGIVHHAGILEPADIVALNGIRVTRASRCAVEVTTIATVEPALVTVNGLLHLGRCSGEELESEAEARKHWPDTLATTIVLRLSDARVQSVAESRSLFLCWSEHLPRPELQVPVRDESGNVFAYTDFLWKDEGVFLEFDGRIKYDLFRRKNETLEEFLMREKRREELICQLTGWVCIRITWADLERPQRTAERIRRILRSRRRPLPA